jgi:hypothetical protein
MLARINEWRLAEGQWPLKPNPLLEMLALEQAQYIHPSLSSISDYAGYHTDAQGRNPRQRAVANGWPRYGTGDQIEIGENAGVGAARFAMDFWKGSDIHRRAALGANYREVGVAALPTRNGFLYMVVFGARPGVLPAQLSPDGRSLYLTNEQSRYAPANSAPLQVRVFDAQGQPLTATLNWQQVIALPQTSESYTILFTQGEQQSVATLTSTRDTVVLPAGLSLAAAPTVNPTASATPASVIAPKPTSLPTVTSPPANSSRPTAAPGGSGVGGELLLIYDRSGLTVYNASSAPVDISGLTIGSSVGQTTVERWNSIAGFPVSAFPAGHCLFVQQINSSASAASLCRSVRSVLTLNTDRIYWASGTFEVKRGDTVLTTCEASAGQCAVDLP